MQPQQPQDGVVPAAADPPRTGARLVAAPSADCRVRVLSRRAYVFTIGYSRGELRSPGLLRSAVVSFELPLPSFRDSDEDPRLSAAAEYLRNLLLAAVPGVRIAAIARRPGVVSKVAVRGTLVSGEAVARVREQLDGELIQIVQWHRDPRAYIAAALGLPEVPPMVLKPAIRHANLLLGEIDLRGMSGWRGINRLLASALTGWRIHLMPLSETPAWGLLVSAMRDGRALSAHVIESAPRGLRLEVHGLCALLPRTEALEPGTELQVRISRMNADEGRIIVSQRLKPSGQLALPHK